MHRKPYFRVCHSAHGTQGRSLWGPGNPWRSPGELQVRPGAPRGPQERPRTFLGGGLGTLRNQPGSPLGRPRDPRDPQGPPGTFSISTQPGPAQFAARLNKNDAIHDKKRKTSNVHFIHANVGGRSETIPHLGIYIYIRTSSSWNAFRCCFIVV